MRRAFLVAVLVAAVGHLETAPAAAGGVFSVDCDYLPYDSSEAQPIRKFQTIDPIAYYGVEESPHLHIFRGNRRIAHNSTFGTLHSVDASQTTCSRNSDPSVPGSGDLSSYWAPTLIKVTTDSNGVLKERIEPVRINTYYEAPHADPTAIQPFPDGLKLKALDPTTEAQSRPEVQGSQLPGLQGARLGCVPGQLQELPSGAVQCIDDDPLDSRTPQLRLMVKFPSCLKPGYEPKSPLTFSGRDQDDSAAVTYPIQSGSSWVCPPPFTTPIPQVFVQFGWQSAGGHDHYLSHRLPGMQANDKWHADFFDAWNKDVLTKLVVNCLRAGVDCGRGDGPPPAQPAQDPLDADPEPCPAGCDSTASPLAHWGFDELAGTTAFDRSLGAHHGTYLGRHELGAPPLRPSAANDPADRSAILRDAVSGSGETSGRVSVPDSAALRPGAGAFTIEGWARFPDTAQMAVLYSKRPSSGHPMLVLYLGKYDNTSDYAGRKLCLVLTQTATIQRNTCTEADVADGGVHHFAVRVDPAALDLHDRITLYLDGRPVQDRVATWTGGWPHMNTSAPVQIGGNSDLETSQVGPASLDAAIDELRLYKGLRSSAEIAEEHARGVAAPGGGG